MSGDFGANSPRELVRLGKLAQTLGVSTSYVRKLADAGVLPFRRTAGGHRVFDLPSARAAFEKRLEGRAFNLSLDLAGLEEDRVWRQILQEAPLRSPTPAARSISQFAFTEILNNAIDHSGGSNVDIAWLPGPALIRATIADNGVGAFERVRGVYALANHHEALEQLSKGKLSTQPQRHSGEGLFFTSRAVDLFELEANQLRWIVDNRRTDVALGASSYGPGTRVTFEVDAATDRNLEMLFGQFTDEDHRFARSSVVIKLYERGAEFVSRSEAKRVVVGLEKFSEVVLDFRDVESVGQGFADEVFRVWARDHREVRLTPINMNAGVALIVGRALAAAEEG